MAFKKRKGEGGEAKRYISRNRAAKLLQLGLPEFRRLCILKGIYPREPKSRKKAQKGDTSLKTLYLKRDIIYLSHEPIIWKLREEKIYRRKLTTLITKREKKQAKFYRQYARPTYKLDHVVLERYPTFDKALQDLDDTISTCFVYAALPNALGINSEMVHLCKKLTREFLHYVIEARALRKTFISIKGYFYRAHIQGEKVTWMVPHPFPPEFPEKAEMRIMGTFVDLYCTHLGFVNYKLYQSLNLIYPPKPSLKSNRSVNASRNEDKMTIIESLSIPLDRQFVDAIEEDDYDMRLMGMKKNKLKLAMEEQEKIKRQMVLFDKVKFFLGRETNRESLTFVIRSAGGLVSWDESCGPGATYDENDKDIQYQIVDRPSIEKKHLTRYYVQPQWLYDSFNAALLLPVQDYFVGVELPAHLSPFEETYRVDYKPPEMLRVEALQNKIKLIGDRTVEDQVNDLLSSGEEEDDKDASNKSNKPKLSGYQRRKLRKMRNTIPVPPKDDDDDEEEGEDKEGNKDDDDDDDKEEGEDEVEAEEDKEDANDDDEGEDKEEGEDDKEEEEEEDPLAKMRVDRGRPFRVNAKDLQRRQESEDFKLAVKFIHRKQRRLFQKIRKNEQKTEKRAKDLKRKRVLYEHEMLKRKRKQVKGEEEKSNLGQ